jgi:CRP-like cAMP-binding protein
MNRQELMETLQGIRFLHDFSPEHLEQIANVASLCNYNELDVVFREGEVAKNLYFVAYGNVSVEICAPGIGCKRILTVGPGEVLGWSALLGPARLTATARTLDATRLVKIDAAQLLTICEHDSRFGYELMRRAMLALATRLSATRMQLLDVYGSQLPATAFAGEGYDAD